MVDYEIMTDLDGSVLNAASGAVGAGPADRRTASNSETSQRLVR